MNQQDLPLAGLRVLFGAETFPNRIQPWVLNWIVESIANGAHAAICAYGRRGDTYQASVDAHRLIERTVYVRPDSAGGVLTGIAQILDRDHAKRKIAWRGLTRLPFAKSDTTPAVRQALKNAALSPLLGLEGIDLIHSHAMNMTYTLIPVARAWGVPLVATFHGLPPRGVGMLAEEKQREIYRKTDVFFVNTEFARRQLESLGCPAEKISILPQGVVLQDFPFHPSRHPGMEPLRILTVARLHADKGHRFMLEAVARLRQSGRNVIYDVVGVGPLGSELQELANALGIADAVRLYGEASDEQLLQHYREAHVFVLPSLRSEDGFHEETQGVVLQEAQASGKIVVATRSGGIPECIDDGRSGFLVPDRDAEALQCAIERIILSPESWGEWQSAARQWVEERYAMPLLGRRLAAAYRRVLDARDQR